MRRPELEGPRRVMRLSGLALGGSALIAGAAQLSVPMVPVPMTLQSLAVLVLGMAYGSTLGALAALLYLALGAAGLPVFAGMTGGAEHLGGATAGYLAGFPLAALLAGRLAERGWERSLARIAAAMVAGTLVILLCGVLWLATGMGLAQAMAVGLVPLVPGAACKVLLGTAAVAALKALRRPRAP